jgi:outer membrane protein
VKRSVITFITLAAMAAIAHGAAAPAPAPTGKIAVVNTDALLGNSPQFRAAQEALQSEFAPEDRAIQQLAQTLKTREEKLQKDAATMTVAQRTAEERAINDGYIDIQARQKKLEDNIKARSTEEDNKLRRAVLEEVQKYARANGYDVVLSAGVLYANSALDITAPVLEALKARPATPAAAAPAPAPARPTTP